MLNVGCWVLDVALTLLLLFAGSAWAATRYVWQGSPSPGPPYTNWVTAATNVQDAVDAAGAGDEILVTNGVYAAGEREAFDSNGNSVGFSRVAVTNAMTLRSVNGPPFTVISGGGTNRCVFLADGTSLSGFTLTKGAGDRGGGVWCASTEVLVTNCVIRSNSASSFGGGAYGGTLNNCTLTGNWITDYGDGGGACGGTLNNCTLASNSAWLGGGAKDSTLYDCTLTGNSAAGGGAAYGGTLYSCALMGNSASDGGGVSGGTLYHCALTGNTAAEYGGGALGGMLGNCTLTDNAATDCGGGVYGATLDNCMLTGNSAAYGGGAYSGTLNHCTLTSNSALSDPRVSNGGGAMRSTLNNCIVYFNTVYLSTESGDVNYDSSCILNYCCTTPLPTNGVGNISADPELASASHLSVFSPCRGAGGYAMGTDIDGETWATPPAIGCDEYHAGAATGPLSVDIVAASTSVAVDCPISLMAVIGGRPSLSVWDFGDGTLSFDHPYERHAWSAPGDYVVSLWALNDSAPDGVTATVTMHVVQSPVHYVAVGNPNPVAPYLSWATAATAIQDAVDAAYPGGTVLVSNGVYAVGGRAVYGALPNRVAVDKVLAVRSVNGPQFTIIQGSQAPGGGTGDGAIRCVYLSTGASLSGFTLTDGATQRPDKYQPPYHEVIGGGLWCDSTNAWVTNCVFAGNSAYQDGGGAYGGTLYNCTLTSNSVHYSGGGASGSTLYNCTLAGNSASYGGGASGSTLYNCTLTSNAAYTTGGGALGGTLYNCTLTGNSTYGKGGGAEFSTLYNCEVTGNTAQDGGGVYSGTLINCTLTGNSAKRYGGGVHSGTLTNCIVYFNTATNGLNHYSSTLRYCCTTPLPTNGVGNISTDPELATASHLSIFSPCRGAGSAAYTCGVDIDGESWANPPSIGCDEYRAGAVTGPLSVGILADYTNVMVGYPVNLAAVIEGRASLSLWEFGDGELDLNEPFTTHTWTAPGDYVVSLWAINDSQPEWEGASVTIHVGLGLHYVAADSAHPVSPYTSWATAATNIQDAVDAAVIGGTVLVTNGTYATGGRTAVGSWTTNRVAVDKLLTVRSINGPQVTVIQGYEGPWVMSGSSRCVYLTNGASLSGFTLTNGMANMGGGLWCQSKNAYATNCIIVGNTASGYGGGVYSGTLIDCSLLRNSAVDGGGAYHSILNDCTLTGNSATRYGGGACGDEYNSCTLSNCTITGNSAQYGGGADACMLYNCTLTGNSASDSGGGAHHGTLNHCTLTGNWATNYYGGGVDGGMLYNCALNGNRAPYGGGAFNSTLINCTLTGNSAHNGGGADGGELYNCTLIGNMAYRGGGAYGSAVYNCTLTGNSATNAGGGAAYGTLTNCIVYFNTATNGPNYYSNTLRYCCTTPNPGGAGNITLNPLFVDQTNGNLRLQANSPCINAGNNSCLTNSYSYFTNLVELDGNPRIYGNRVDLGAYEFQGVPLDAFHTWLQHYGLPTDGSADYIDTDGDRLNNWQEWRCGTCPTNALSVLRLLSATRAGTNVTVTWQSVAGVNYFLERATNLSHSPLLTPLATNIPGQPGTTTYTDTNAARASPHFYRVGVGN
jgi:hypothetical protein